MPKFLVLTRDGQQSAALL